MTDLYKSFYHSILPSISGIFIAHPMLTLKVNQQVIGGNPKNLYSGLGLYLTKSVPANTITFMMLQDKRIKDLQPSVQGAVTRLTAEFLVYPLSLWSTKKQVGQGISRNALFKGVAPTLGRDLVFSTVFLQIHRGWLGDSQLPLPLRLMCAATGASLATQPMDWLKVRSQLNMPMSNLFSGWAWRLAYCNTRSVVAWGLFEVFTKKN